MPSVSSLLSNPAPKRQPKPPSRPSNPTTPKASTTKALPKASKRTPPKARAPSAPAHSAPNPSAPNPSGPAPSAPTPSGPAPSAPNPSAPAAPPAALPAPPKVRPRLPVSPCASSFGLTPLCGVHVLQKRRKGRATVWDHATRKPHKADPLSSISRLTALNAVFDHGLAGGDRRDAG